MYCGHLIASFLRNKTSKVTTVFVFDLLLQLGLRDKARVRVILSQSAKLIVGDGTIRRCSAVAKLNKNNS